jgi:hypothetical protein
LFMSDAADMSMSPMPRRVAKSKIRGSR